MKLTPDFILKDIEDEYVRENFNRLNDFMRAFPLFKGSFKFCNLVFDRALTNQKIAHGLGFKPTDVLVSRVLGPGILTFEYLDFDDKSLVITTTGACQVRAFIGAYREDK